MDVVSAGSHRAGRSSIACATWGLSSSSHLASFRVTASEDEAPCRLVNCIAPLRARFRVRELLQAFGSRSSVTGWRLRPLGARARPLWSAQRLL